MVRRYGRIFALVLSFPTVMSAMRGYIALSTPYVKLEDKALLPWYDFTLRWAEQPAAHVADGDRIGLQPNQVIFKSNDEQIYKALQNCVFVSLPDAHLHAGLISHFFFFSRLIQIHTISTQASA